MQVGLLHQKYTTISTINHVVYNTEVGCLMNCSYDNSNPAFEVIAKTSLARSVVFFL